MRILQSVRVPAGFLFGAIFLYLARPTPTGLVIGGTVALTGLLLRVWAAGCIEKGRRLAVTGPYRWTRNPLYLGSFLMGFGFSLASGLPWMVVLFALLFAVFYVPVMKQEEKELEAGFGTDFDSYRREVSFFLPRPARRPVPTGFPADGGNFSWSRVILNREYNAVAGFLIVSAILIIKMVWT